MRSSTTVSLLFLLIAAASVQAQVVTHVGTAAGAQRATVTSALPSILRVDWSASGAGTGSSWADAFSDLQLALAAAGQGDELWVARGTYTPSPGDASASFVLRSGVALYGGFDGTESARSQRDWTQNESILSGDIGHDDIVSPWPSGWLINSSNCGHVVVASGVDETATLDGFTIANGHTGPTGTPAGNPLMFGSGIYIIAGSPTIRHCVLTHNLAAFAAGGGLYCLDGAPTLEGCDFVENYAHSANGGGAWFHGDSLPIVRDCRFSGNIVVSTSISGGDGSAAGLGYNSTNWCTVERCVFDRNLARSFFTVGSSIAYGGGVWAWNGGLTIVDSVFTHNTAHYGGGLMIWGPGRVVNCLFQDNIATVLPNDPYPEGGGYGAGIAMQTYASVQLEVVNTTLAYNHGKKFVGIDSLGTASFSLDNCIVWGNVASHPEVIGYWTEQLGGSFALSYSCVAKIFDPPGPGEDPIDPSDLPGCLDLAPGFVSGSALGDLSLAPGSACIDAGDNAPIAGTALDLAGNERFVDDAATPDTGSGSAPIVDMGAYEFGG